MKYPLTVQIEMDILHPAISHENEPTFSAKMCCTHSVQFSSLVVFCFLFFCCCMACTDFEPVLECGALAVLQQVHRALALPHPPPKPGAPLFAIRVCLLLVALAQ